ncbi:MAG: hypothetical protein Unbinned7865contig1001_75 [Prokaryotic dsDNA virus sp.]|nr:MAG: hypothetical protein Unbinned7865contig1001_75 [Prokaryotic dsDNA virus sp.]|tara:strand:- start:19989 stop:20243 length:255 start_codon:yes stop_codon:yes gene_type:complete
MTEIVRTAIGRALIGLGVLIVPDQYWDEMVKAIRKEAACIGKDPLDVGAAKSLVRRIRRRKGSPISAYRCTHCKRWHVGSDKLT